MGLAKKMAASGGGGGGGGPIPAVFGSIPSGAPMAGYDAAKAATAGAPGAPPAGGGGMYGQPQPSSMAAGGAYPGAPSAPPATAMRSAPYPSVYPGAPGGGAPGAPAGYAGAPGGYPGAPAAVGSYPGGYPGGAPGGAPPGGAYPGAGMGAAPGGYGGGAPAGGYAAGAPPGAGMYGAPPAPPGASGYAGMAPPAAAGAHARPAGGMMSEAALRSKITTIIMQNGLQPLYPPPALDAVIARLMRVDWAGLASAWHLSMEMVVDFAALALYDVVIFCDDSGSMAFEEGGDRIDDLKLIVSRVAEIASLFDEDGIAVRFINSDIEGNNIRSAAEVHSLIGRITFTGGTPLGERLDSRVLVPFVHNALARRTFRKPVAVFIITDGEPSSKQAVRASLSRAAAACGAAGIPGGVTFEFCQVGKDKKAEAYLGELDDDPEIGRYIDATSYFENEQEQYARKGLALTPELYLLKLMLGSVDSSYDDQDE